MFWSNKSEDVFGSTTEHKPREFRQPYLQEREIQMVTFADGRVLAATKLGQKIIIDYWGHRMYSLYEGAALVKSMVGKVDMIEYKNTYMVEQ